MKKKKEDLKEEVEMFSDTPYCIPQRIGYGIRTSTSVSVLLSFKLENPKELESEHFGRAEEDEKNGNEEGKQFGGKKGGSVK
ncbi:hypothetical protein L3X38_010380 [Prunus dulcis]|uniref:Uncharacterized protein n=1 Tax=Prunus dulcis TaxID=3755 RepID=A0AAD4ZDZ1_PRUDU|nr:hypothetical protein L3X38_010380 [Prunus dulcis]